jgi:hypothetical protein
MRGGCFAKRGCFARGGCFTCNSACRSRGLVPVHRRLSRAPSSADASRETRGEWAHIPTFATRSPRLNTASNTGQAPSGIGWVRSRTAAESRPGVSGPSELLATLGRDQRDDHAGTGAPGRTPRGGPFDGAPQHTDHKHDTDDSSRSRRIAPSKRAPSEPRYPRLAKRHASAASEPRSTSPSWARPASTASRQTGEPPRMLESVRSIRPKWGPDWARSSPARTRKVASARRRR